MPKMPELLEFEEPVGVLLKEIEALSMLPKTPEREKSIDSLRRRAEEIRAELFQNLTPWQRVLVARHPNRPNTLDYVERLFTDFDELHGDRRFADDHAIVCGLGGSGGALGIAIGDRVLMQEFSVYSVIPPEGCAAILWRDANKKVEAATALKITAPDMLGLGLVDGIIPEPPGGAHNDYDAATALVDQALAAALADLEPLPAAVRLDVRYEK